MGRWKSLLESSKSLTKKGKIMKIDAQKLLDIINKEVDYMKKNNHLSGEILIGEIDNIQIIVKVTQDEDDFIEKGNDDFNCLIDDSNESIKVGDKVVVWESNVSGFSVGEDGILIAIDSRETSLPYLINIGGKMPYWVDKDLSYKNEVRFKKI